MYTRFLRVCVRGWGRLGRLGRLGCVRRAIHCSDVIGLRITEDDEPALKLQQKLSAAVFRSRNAGMGTSGKVKRARS